MEDVIALTRVIKLPCSYLCMGLISIAKNLIDNVPEVSVMQCDSVWAGFCQLCSALTS